VELLAIPALLWIATRPGRWPVVAGLGALAAGSSIATALGVGPFVRSTPLQSFLSLAAYLCAMTLVSLVVARLAADRARAQTRLADLSETDVLTGLGNYRRLLAVMRGEIARSDRSKRPFAVLVIDVDGLKRINDTGGYRTGSRALVRVADANRQTCRTTDTPARFGGDEFAVVLTETDRTGAERLLGRIAEHLRSRDEMPAVTVTGGIAAYPDDGGTPGKLLRVAGEQHASGPAEAGPSNAGPSSDAGQRDGEQDELLGAGSSRVDVAPFRQRVLVAAPRPADGHRRDVVDDADVAVG
jgi:diguanylate cyclase (GGDEF)-like protein